MAAYIATSLRFLFVVLSFITIAGAASAQQLTFARDDYASNAGARAIAVGDFDRNGWPDIAQANAGRNTVTILLNHHGRLTTAFDIPVGAGPFDIASGDVNRDGLIDLAVANADANIISILLGKPDGSFTKSIDLANPGVVSPRGVAIADLNGDGRLDVVATGYRTNAVQRWYGDGLGGFTLGGGLNGFANQPQGVAVADLNYDGRAEIVLAYDSAAGLAVISGASAAGTPAAVAGAQNLNVIALADLNADGWIDVAAASTRDGRVALFLGGAAGLTFSRTYATGMSPRGIAVADLNADGALDIVTANFSSSTVSVLLGSRLARGTFSAAMDVASNQGSRAVAIADFNQDARLDVATGNQQVAFTTVLENQTIFKPAAFAFTKTTHGAPSNAWSSDNDVVVADFNHDGRPDFATRAEPVGVAVLFTGAATVTFKTQSDAWGSADFNHDGNQDVVVVSGYPGATISTYLGDGHGAFSAAQQTTTTINVYRAIVGELNGDASPDVVLSGAVGSSWVVQVLLGTGAGTFRAGTSIPLSGFAPGLLVADLNRDGKSDLAMLLYAGGMQVAYSNGAGGFSSTALFSVALDNIPTSLRAADLNRDGLVDIVASSDVQMAVLLATANGFAAPAYISGAHGNWNGPAVTDVNGDGALDIVSDEGAILSGNGDGTFETPSLFDWTNSAGASVVDFNRDGVPDVIAGASVGEVLVLLNSRGAVNHPPAVDAGRDETINYQRQFGGEDFGFGAIGSDPDAHAVRFEWRDQNGTVVSNDSWVFVLPLRPGTYTYTVTATDGRGGSATDSKTITIEPAREIVLYPGDGSYVEGSARWRTGVEDATAAGGYRAYNPNGNAPKITAPLANPPSTLIVEFAADPTKTYKLWMRLKADGNSFSNDSVWVQFSGAVNAAGAPVYRRGTTSGLAVNLEECSGCGVSGWGWEDDGWGAVNRNGVTLRFPEGGRQFLYIQQREDGVSIDQIVLSSEKYLTARPGTAKNDTTILLRTFAPE